MPDKAQKYIEIDVETGKPGYINKEKGQKIDGVPDDERLCHIAFETETKTKTGTKPVTKTVDGEQVPAVLFSCDPSVKCSTNNAGATAQKDKARAALGEEQKTIKRLTEELEEINNKKKPTEADKERKKEIKKKLKKSQETAEALQAYLRSFSPYCAMRGVSKDEKDVKLADSKLTLDEIKNLKLRYLFCACETITVPKPSKETGLK